MDLPPVRPLRRRPRAPPIPASGRECTRNPPRADETHIERPHPSMNARPMSSNLNSILSLEVPLIVEIAQRRMPLAEAVNLVHGAIVEFPQASNGELRILVNNKAVGTGTAVKVGENFGVRVSSVGDMTSRVEALKG
ncbi:MAG: hypothetical protein CMJ52_04850 [Planctomycetaceae bacterium]|nr:hypothetical protein [Planctomycetaceae bacterium]